MLKARILVLGGQISSQKILRLIAWPGVRNYPGVLFDANAHGRAQGADADAQRSEEERKQSL